ncbi:MAG TPA: DHHA1 domain-containing protein [Candidatus Nanoarchaeia archaeon]|nr:DHHA1 domain-containing protein [Candidatus Nanoarchaeia archaeon]
MLPAKKIAELKKELDNCQKPVFIYDKDCDGLCSFLLFRKYKGEGTGFPLVSKSFEESFIKLIKDEEPDKIFFLDIPTVPEHVVETLKVPCVQVDHHLGGEKVHGLKIFNPRDHKKEDGSPTSAICYNVVKQNEWIAVTGIVADWHITKETKAFAKKHPNLLDPKIKKPDVAMFESTVGLLGRIFNFILKGKSSDMHKTIKALMKIKRPEEILDQTTEEGALVYKQYYSINERYKEVIIQAEKQVTKEKLIVIRYSGVRHGEGELSFSSELSNELLHKYPKKVLIIAREKNEEMKCSLRSGKTEIRTKLLKALKGVEGHGGGHDKACGANIKAKDFDLFLRQFKAQLKQ